MHSLHKYTEDWNLTVNVQKTKIIVFRNGKCINNEDKWEYKGNIVEDVNQFNYL